MHSAHEIGYPSAETSPSGTGKLSNPLSGVSASVAGESFSRALASAIAHNATMTGSAVQDTSTPGEGAQQRSVAAIVAGAHGNGDAAVFSRVVKASGHVQWQGRAEISTFSADTQAKHGDRWHHELKPVGPVKVT
jgi:hypothetical protein